VVSFFYEEAASFIERRAVGGVGSVVSRTEAAQGWAWTAMGLEPCVFTGDSVGPAHRSPVARSAGGASRRFHLLAAVADVGGAGCLAASLAETAGADGRAQAAGLGGGLSGRDFRHREKRGLGVGKTRRGKGTKCMVVVDGRGVPVGTQLASAQISEHRLAESTLEQVKVPRSGRGRPRSRLRRVIADRGYDSDPLRLRLKRRGTELIAPYRSNNRHRRFEDLRKLRRYRKRWKIERTNAWLQNFRRIQVRYDRILTVFQGFFHCACLLITLRYLCNQL
jgi:transposase